MLRLFRTPKYRVGDRVRIKSLDAILATLDENGAIGNMPFMPEMIRFCGTEATVSAIAHKTCDTVNYSGIRWMPDTVHLGDTRCDGAAHGGCQADCLLFWKTAWLEPLTNSVVARPMRSDTGIDEAKLAALTSQGEEGAADQRYYCQVTEILNATKSWAWWNPTQFLIDVIKGNSSLGRSAAIIFLAVLRHTIPITAYNLQIRLYNVIAARTGRPEYMAMHAWRGQIELDQPTPVQKHDYDVGDWVRIKPLAEISKTLNKQGQNRGMFFDAEMIPYCDKSFQVRDVVTRLIEEGTGKMMHMKNPCISLDKVICKSEYSKERLLCPRAIRSYWRPIWLEKVNQTDDVSDASEF